MAELTWSLSEIGHESNPDALPGACSHFEEPRDGYLGEFLINENLPHPSAADSLWAEFGTEQAESNHLLAHMPASS